MTPRQVLLVNPTITSRRSARFPLAVMQLASALAPQGRAKIVDGNLDRDFVASACAAVRDGAADLVGISVMGGPQLPAGYGRLGAIPPVSGIILGSRSAP